MKHMTISEFSEYVDGLEFEELEDVSAFIKGYFDAYKAIPDEQEEEKDQAWLKYVVLASKYCMTFMAYFDMSLKYRKELQEQLDMVDEEFDGEFEEDT